MVGYLNTATSRIAPVIYFEVESGESTVEVDFVSDDDLPLPCVHSGSNFIEHPESDEVGSDFLWKGKARMTKNWRRLNRFGLKN